MSLTRATSRVIDTNFKHTLDIATEFVPLTFTHAPTNAKTQFTFFDSDSPGISPMLDIDVLDGDPASKHDIRFFRRTNTTAPVIASFLRGDNTPVAAASICTNGLSATFFNLFGGNFGIRTNTPNEALTVVGNVSATGTFAGGSATGFRNKIINGDMRIDQRYAGALQTWNRPATFFIVDRFRFGGSDGINTRGNWTTQRVTDAPPGFVNSVRIQNTAIATLTNDGGTKTFCQNIEGNNVINFQWGTSNAKTATLSFWVKASIAGVYILSVSNGRGDAGTGRSYAASYRINSPNIWEFKTITIPGPTNGVFADPNELNTSGIRIDWYLGMSTDAGSIASPSDLNVWTILTGTPVVSRYNLTGSVNPWLNVNSVWQIAGVQLEEGPVATPFEQRPIGTELALCQRYYQSYPGNWTNAGYTTSGTAQVITTPLPVPMRVSPVINFTPFSVVNATLAYFDDGGSTDRVFFGVFSTSSTGGVFQYTAQNATFNAEL